MNKIKAQDIYEPFADLLLKFNAEQGSPKTEGEIRSIAYETAVKIEDIWKDYHE